MENIFWNTEICKTYLQTSSDYLTIPKQAKQTANNTSERRMFVNTCVLE